MNRYSLLVVSFVASLLVAYAATPAAALATPVPTQTPTPTQAPTETPQWLIGFLTATSLAIVGWVLTWLQRKVSKREEQRAAAAALRFELQSNLGWIGDILDTRNYLRDEAWTVMRTKGYISYLPEPIPMKVVKVYDQLQGVNERIRILKETPQEVNKSFDSIEADARKTLLRESMEELAALLDAEYPEIGRNFRET